MSHALHLDGMKCNKMLYDSCIESFMVWIQICVIIYMCGDIIHKAHMQLESGTYTIFKILNVLKYVDFSYIEICDFFSMKKMY
jgi:hypothetical protein